MEKNEIIKIYGTDYKEMTRLLLEQADLISAVPEGAKRIGIKPNLVTPTPASFGATTHPEILAGLIEYLKENGDFELHLRDNARSFNPFSMYTRRFRRTDAEKDTDTLGILIVKEKAKHFFYRRYLGFNVLVITV